MRQRDAEQGWQRPVGIAVALHILTFALSVSLPMLLNHRPLLDNVVTVNLVSLPEAGQEAPQPPAPAAEQAAPPEPAPEPEPVPKLEPVKPKIQVPGHRKGPPWVGRPQGRRTACFPVGGTWKP